MKKEQYVYINLNNEYTRVKVIAKEITLEAFEYEPKVSLLVENPYTGEYLRVYHWGKDEL